MISKPGAGPVQKTGKYAVSARKVLGVTQYNVPNENNGYMLNGAVTGKLPEVKDFVCNSC